jgi:hypothetical protein
MWKRKLADLAGVSPLPTIPTPTEDESQRILNEFAKGAMSVEFQVGWSRQAGAEVLVAHLSLLRDIPPATRYHQLSELDRDTLEMIAYKVHRARA